MCPWGPDREEGEGRKARGRWTISLPLLVCCGVGTAASDGAHRRDFEKSSLTATSERRANWLTIRKAKAVTVSNLSWESLVAQNLGVQRSLSAPLRCASELSQTGPQNVNSKTTYLPTGKQRHTERRLNGGGWKTAHNFIPYILPKHLASMNLN